MSSPAPHPNPRPGAFAHPLCAAVALLAITLLLPSSLHAQLPAGTTDASSSSSLHASPEPADPLRAQASDALNRGDYTAALKLLLNLADRNPTDPHILFDLASTQDALDQNTAAIATYRRAIAADPTYFEPHLALGLLLARSGHTADARTELLTAVTLHAPDDALKARAFRALAHLDQTLNPAEARDALLNALKLSPETDDDTLLSAALAESAHDTTSAEAAYRRILARSPGDPAATAALAHLLLAADSSPTAASPAPATSDPAPTSAEAEAETLLTAALADHPGDAVLTSELIRLDLRQGNPGAALTLAAELHAAHPSDTDLTRLYARLLSQTGDYAAAEPLFAALSTQSPADPILLDDHADALIHLHRPAEAQPLLERAVAQPSAFPSPTDLGNAASHLAFAATQNNHPEVALQALALRATVLPQSPATLFLAATANDKLHRLRQATDLYKEFLATANGKFPDEEFEARHRLVALAHSR